MNSLFLHFEIIIYYFDFKIYWWNRPNFLRGIKVWWTPPLIFFSGVCPGKGKEADEGSGEQVLWRAAEWTEIKFGEEDAQGRHYTLYKYLKEGYEEVGIELFSHITSYKTRGNGLKLQQGRYRLDIRNNFFFEGVVRHWNGSSREVTELLSLEVKKHLDVAKRDIF